MNVKNKLLIKRISNNNRYNELDLEKSEVFLTNLQEFVLNLDLVKVVQGEYEFNGDSYDVNTYYTLFFEDPNDNFQVKKLGIDDFGNGELVRYFNNQLELLILFLDNKIKLIFYCDVKYRAKIINLLSKFCKFDE